MSVPDPFSGMQLPAPVVDSKEFMRILIISAALMFATTGQTQEWTRFRGPNGTGISEAKTIPTRWTESDINWKIALPGTGHSSPVVWGDKVFVTSFEERSGRFLVICVGAKDGGVLWQKEYTLTPSSKHDFNSFASATPTVDAERVYLCRAEASRLTLFALDRAGNELWERDLGAFEMNHGSGASPILCGELVILANEQRGDSFWIAVDARTGETRWSVPRTSAAGNYSTPCIFESAEGKPAIIFNSEAHGISALAPDTGEVLWEFAEAFDKRSVSSPVIADDLLIGSCGSGGGGNYVVAVRAGTPDRQPERVYEIRRSAPYVPTSICIGDWLYLWSGGGIVSRVHAVTGEVAWQERTGGRFFGSPVCVNNRLFCVSTTGEVVVIGVSDQFEVLARNALNETTHSTPAVAGGRMYIHTAGHLISIGGNQADVNDTSKSGT